MSGTISGITKTFKAVGSAAARLGKAVLGVGATTFTAGAATAAGPMAAGGLSGIIQKFTGSGVLGNILSGAIKQAGFGALLGGAVGALTGQGFGKGALMGGLTGAVTGGLSGASKGGLFTAAGMVPGDTATGMVPTGSTGASGAPAAVASTVPVAAPAAPQGGGGFMKFLGSEAGGSMLAGLGDGLSMYAQTKAQEKERERDRQYLREKEERLTRSYDLPAEVMPGGSGGGGGGTTAPKPSEKWRYQYDPSVRNVVRVPV